MKAEPETIKIAADYHVDHLDRQILACLMKDATTPYTDIAQQLTVSNGTVHVRMKKLREVGIVKGAHLEVDVQKLGFDIIAYVQVLLEKDTDSDEIIDAMNDIPEIVEANFLTGAFCMLVKLVCRNSAHLLYVLKDRIQKMEGVRRTETSILLEHGIKRPPLVEQET